MEGGSISFFLARHNLYLDPAYPYYIIGNCSLVFTFHREIGNCDVCKFVIFNIDKEETIKEFVPAFGFPSQV